MVLLDGSELQRSFETSDFFFAYQPICNLNDGSVSRLEALLRWQHPKLGAAMPNDFLPLIFGAGLSTELTTCSVRQIMHDLPGLRELYGDDISVAMNISREQVGVGSDVAGTILAELAATAESPSVLAVEVVEDFTAVDVKHAAGAFADLRAAGVLVYLDDFGTGASSLSTLLEMGYDGLKIDRRFVQALSTSVAARSVVEAVVKFTNDTGISLVAEGIETDAELTALRTIGCSLGQGYHLAWPRPLTALSNESGDDDAEPTWLFLPSGGDGTPAELGSNGADIAALTAQFEDLTASFLVKSHDIEGRVRELGELLDKSALLGNVGLELQCNVGRELAFLETQLKNHDRVTELALRTYGLAVELERWSLAAEMLLYVTLCPWEENPKDAGRRIDALTEALRIRLTKPMASDERAVIDNLIGLFFRILGLAHLAEEWFRSGAHTSEPNVTLQSSFGQLNLASMLIEVLEGAPELVIDKPREIMLAMVSQALDTVEAHVDTVPLVLNALRCRLAIQQKDLVAAAAHADTLELDDTNVMALAFSLRAKARLGQATGDAEMFLEHAAAYVELLPKLPWYFPLAALRLYGAALAANGQTDESRAVARQVAAEEQANYRRNVSVLFEWIRRNVDLNIHFNEMFRPED